MRDTLLFSDVLALASGPWRLLTWTQTGDESPARSGPLSAPFSAALAMRREVRR